jgi:hypothetical protein
MALHIEQNSRWANKLNNQMRKCYESIENPCKPEVAMMDGNIKNFEDIFVEIAEYV